MLGDKFIVISSFVCVKVLLTPFTKTESTVNEFINSNNIVFNGLLTTCAYIVPIPLLIVFEVFVTSTSIL